MASKRVSISTKKILRRELPSVERRGAVAQEIMGDQILVITFHQAKVDFETMDGVAAEIPSDLREMHSGISDTVVLGSVSRDGVVWLLDLFILDKKSYRGTPWSERFGVLEQVIEKLPEDVREKVRLDRIWDRGLMRVFDAVKENGGMGLLLRERGKTVATICSGR